MARTPKTQQAILTLLETQHMLSAQSLLALLKVNSSRLNKTTIYRALEKLLSEGKICKQSFGHDECVFELRSDHHDHLVCESCGSVTSIPCQTTKIQLPKGYTLSHHHLTAFVVCEKCQQH